MVDRPRLLIATSNPGKLREVRAILGDSSFEVLTLADFPGISEAEEDGHTFEENARKKAVHYHLLTSVSTLADDSGLEVDALGGAPGIHSARFCGTHGNDAANNAKLVEQLRGVPLDRRTARFRCVVALAHRGSIAAVASGSVEGVIVDEPRGNLGFGYDPHFLLREWGLTKAELPLEQKNKISHRGKAVRLILAEMRQLLGVHDDR